MSGARQIGPWVFSALVSAGVHIGAVAVLAAALPSLEAPAAPTQFILASLEAPAQVEVEAMAANTVVPAVAAASEPAATSAPAIAPERLQTTRVEAVAALASPAPVLSAKPATGATAATAAIPGKAAIVGSQEQAVGLEPAAGAPAPVTTTAAAAFAASSSASVPAASELAPTAAPARAMAQAEGPQVIANAGIASTVTATTPALTAAAIGTQASASIPTASALAPVAAAATAEAQANSPQPIAGAALPAANAAGPLAAPGTLAATVAAGMGGIASTVPTAAAIAPVAGAQARAPGPTATLATPLPTAAAVAGGSQAAPAVVGAQAPGNASTVPLAAAPVAVTAALSASGATLAPLSPDVEPVAGLDALDDYLAGYDGGDCFAVLPERPDAGTVALTAFAGSPAAAGAFVEALARDFGATLPVEARTVSQGQCGALSFVRSSALYPGFDLGLALDADAIAVGGPLSGEVLRMTGAWLTLVVIDDEGRVSNLDAHVRPEGGAIRFEAPVVPTGEAAGKTQLLLAVATAERLAVNPQDGDTAQAFLAALEAELRTRDIAAELAVAAFTVD